MYPNAPQPHRPTNYWPVLVLCLGVMLIALWVGLRTMSAHFSPAAAPAAQAAGPPAAAPAAKPSTAPVASVAAASVAPAVPSAAAAGDALTPVDVDPQALQSSPGTYRSRVVRVKGTIFYTGQVEDGKMWVQIVGPDNVYVDGVTDGALPSGVSKGASVQVTGIGAGLTSITASNGKDYDQAYIDPIQKIEVLPG